MYIPKPVAKWVTKNVKLRGIPEGEPIVDKFFDIYWESRGERKQVIRNIYSSLSNVNAGQYSIPIEEEYALHVKSRVLFPISLQTASIAMSNGVSGKQLIDTVVNQMLAYGEATIGDDFHDEVLVPLHTSQDKPEELTQDSLYKLIREPNKLKAIALVAGLFKSDKGKMIFSLELLNAALKQAELYRERMSSKPQAYETYLKARDELYKVQALSLLISTALRRGDTSIVLQELGSSTPHYVQNVVNLGNKLADIGKENAAIVFEATQPNNIDKKEAEKIKANLRLFYHGSTLFKQFTEDDSGRLKDDIKNKVDNLWALLALPYHRELNVESVGDYLKHNAHVVSEVLVPPLKEMLEAYDKLKELDFGVSDLQLAIGLVTRQGEKDMRKFQKKLEIALDGAWLLEARDLRQHAPYVM